MSEKIANHVCRNRRCPHGINGEPKHYWACNDCDRLGSWRAVACCPECYQDYITDVEENRRRPSGKTPESAELNFTDIKEKVVNVEEVIVEKANNVQLSALTQRTSQENKKKTKK